MFNLKFGISFAGPTLPGGPGGHGPPTFLEKNIFLSKEIHFFYIIYILSG